MCVTAALTDRAESFATLVPWLHPMLSRWGGIGAELGPESSSTTRCCRLHTTGYVRVCPATIHSSASDPDGGRHSWATASPASPSATSSPTWTSSHPGARQASFGSDGATPARAQQQSPLLDGCPQPPQLQPAAGASSQGPSLDVILLLRLLSTASSCGGAVSGGRWADHH